MRQVNGAKASFFFYLKDLEPLQYKKKFPANENFAGKEGANIFSNWYRTKISDYALNFCLLQQLTKKRIFIYEFTIKNDFEQSLLNRTLRIYDLVI